VAGAALRGCQLTEPALAGLAAIVAIVLWLKPLVDDYGEIDD
jgi:hypothetical protein